MGLGLPIMKQIIDEHKGDISIESERGRETSFSILLPARQSEQELEGKQTLK